MPLVVKPVAGCIEQVDVVAAGGGDLSDLLQHVVGRVVQDDDAGQRAGVAEVRRGEPDHRFVGFFDLLALDVEVELGDVDAVLRQGHGVLKVVAVFFVLQQAVVHHIGALR